MKMFAVRYDMIEEDFEITEHIRVFSTKAAAEEFFDTLDTSDDGDCYFAYIQEEQM